MTDKPYRPDQIPELREPKPIVWAPSKGFGDYCTEAHIGGVMVAWLTPRMAYCDRGHFQVHSNLPGLDAQDGFPRYYMSRKIAIAETEAWLKWRLWKERTRE